MKSDGDAFQGAAFVGRIKNSDRQNSHVDVFERSNLVKRICDLFKLPAHFNTCKEIHYLLKAMPNCSGDLSKYSLFQLGKTAAISI